ncbi:MAG: DUF2252 domain-containing protein [Gemmatimonadales bacterium]
MPTVRKSPRKAVPRGATKGLVPVRPGQSRADLYAMGKALREKCPRESHAGWKPPRNRRDPLELIEASNKGRIPELVPIRHGRMLRSPFTLYRGAALNMAADLAGTPVSGLRVQACGDAHLCNFGDFATPERRVIFDINDLDETLPAPWEWDVKRLAASVVVASRSNGFSRRDARDATLACVRSYREHMAELSDLRVLDVWYASIEVEKVLATLKDKAARERHGKAVARARERSVAEHDFPKLAALSGQQPRIKDNPPLIYHPQEAGGADLLKRTRAVFGQYRETLQEDRRVLLDRFELKDIAMKVVGVGSVGTYCTVMLMMAGEDDPLFLQVKEARKSVLEPYAGSSLHPNHGQRVVNGIRLMQSASDIFLGWAKGLLGRHFYVRQLRDMKISAQVELFTPGVMTQYAEVCAWALARAHARSGSAAPIAGYLGKSDVFDEAIADFAVAYADQTERDYDALMAAARSGRIEVVTEPD